MAHVSIQRSSDLPSCSRCNGPLILAAQMPQLDASGKPISLELCRTCDAGDTAAGALVRFFSSGAGNDTSRAKEGAELIVEFQKEVMAAHGYVLMDNSPPGSSDYPPHIGTPPKGVG
ncbi:DUF6300 family protein [Streptomyces sp. NPDC006458]|uniref:DUF6300 family protein n=1 Tax=Streptomyces TaxID=1883 RepID=UPI0029BB76BA|nr:DUF6300 family protein [Streptomyces scabiei]MDX3207702.1 DUF6300 family protein [Streptomyces scabiei]WTB19931.1 DUF6300 family protein [Streptomyces sp. NBC_00829]